MSLKLMFKVAHDDWMPQRYVDLMKRWEGKPVLVGNPAPFSWWNSRCNADTIWPILREDPLFQELINLGAGPAPCLCQHMFEGAD